MTEPKPDRTIKTNSRGNTRLLVSFHIDLRAEVAAYADAMGMSDQEFIRWGMTLAVATARQQLGPHAPGTEPEPVAETAPEPQPEPVVEEAPRKAPRRPRVKPETAPAPKTVRTAKTATKKKGA